MVDADPEYRFPHGIRGHSERPDRQRDSQRDATVVACSRKDTFVSFLARTDPHRTVPGIVGPHLQRAGSPDLHRNRSVGAGISRNHRATTAQPPRNRPGGH